MHPKTSSIASTSMFQSKINVWFKLLWALGKNDANVPAAVRPTGGDNFSSALPEQGLPLTCLLPPPKEVKGTSCFFIPSLAGGSWPPLHRRAGPELPAELRRPERVSWAQTGTRVVSLRSEAGGAGERTVIMAQLWCNPVPSWRWELIIFFIHSQYLGTRWLRLRDNLSVVSNEEEK